MGADFLRVDNQSPQWRRIAGLIFLIWSSTLTSPALAETPSVHVSHGSNGMVVSASQPASRAGRDMLAKGGSAIDAAVATGFALAVTWPEAGNIGGGGFMMIAPPNEDVICVNYRETAPAAVNSRSFVGWKNRHHARMAGVPGTVRGFEFAHQKHGKLPWKDVVAPAIRLARKGFVVDEHLAKSLNGVLAIPSVRKEKRYAELRRVYGNPDGKPWQAGDTLTQPDLARSLQLIADSGADAFYKGDLAALIVRQVNEDSDGLITREDLAKYKAVVQPAVSGEILGHTVFGAPPPSSGGLTILLQLRMLADRELPTDASTHWTAPQIHLLAEAMRRSFRERAAYLGDPAFVQIPKFLNNPQHARELAGSISMTKATSSRDIAGDIPLTDGPPESPETTHYSVIDADGMAVSNTYTLEQAWGSRIVVRNAGFLLNNEMGDFNWYPGYTNTQGTIGTPPNQLAPGKRMLSSQSPTIVKRDGKVVLVIGSPGGRTIINTVSEIVVQHLMLKRSLEVAIAGPRFHHQWFPDEIRLEDNALLKELAPALRKYGHKVVRPPGNQQGSAHGISVNLRTGVATGVADWRRGGYAAAVQPQKVPARQLAP